MERLKGKTILIGREPGQGRLLVAVGGKAAAIGLPHSVPARVTRCQATEGIAHVKLTVDGEGRMFLTNMKAENVTFVDGSQIESKRISLGNTIELGADRFGINLPLVVESAKKLMGPEIKRFGISHLEKVWDDYQSSLKALRERQKRIGLIRTACGIFTTCAAPLIYFWGRWGYLLTGIGLLGYIICFVKMKNDNTQDEQERLTEEFQDRYVCPNPGCNKFLGNTRYKLLVKQYDMKCPYCKSVFEEK